MPRRVPGARRRGLGVSLVTVLGVILILFAFALSLGFRGQGVTASVQRSVYRDVAEGLAASAAAEALHRVRQGAGDQGSPVFELLRTGNTPATLSLGPEALPFVATEVALVLGYQLDPVEVTVLRRAAASLEVDERVPFEALGVLRVTARVRGPRGSRGDHEVEHGFRAVMTAAPRPFDLATLMILDPRTLLTEGSYRQDANVAIATAAERLATFRTVFRDLAAGFEALAQRIQDLIDEAGESSGEADEALRISRKQAAAFAAAAEEPTWPARAWATRPPDSPTLDRFDELHLFHPELVVYSLADEIELGRLDLPTLVGPHAAYVEADEPELEELGRVFREAVKAEDPSFPSIDQLGDAYRARVLTHAGHLDATLRAYKEFQDLLVEVGGAGREELLLRYRRFRLADQIWKTPYLFRGEGAAGRAAALLAHHPEGLVVVDPSPARETLEVDLDSFSGRLVVASAAPLRVNRVRVVDEARDAVVLVGYQGIEVAGTVEAGIVDLAGAYRSGGESFRGALLLDHVPPGAARELMLRGALRRQVGLASGPEAEGGARPPPLATRIQVVLSPEPMHRKVGL